METTLFSQGKGEGKRLVALQRTQIPREVVASGTIAENSPFVNTLASYPGFKKRTEFLLPILAT